MQIGILARRLRFFEALDVPAAIVPLVTSSHGNVRLDSDEPAGAADNSDVPCSRPAPSAQPVEAPAPRPRSGIACLPAHGLWPELTVATGSRRGSSAGIPLSLSAQPSSEAAMVWTDTHAGRCGAARHGGSRGFFSKYIIFR